MNLYLVNSFGPSDYLVHQFLTTLSKYFNNSQMQLFEADNNNIGISILK